MKRSVNFNGFQPKHRTKYNNAQDFVATCRAVGMTDEEIKAAVLKMVEDQTEQRTMTTNELTQALASDNLRLAAGDEAGWYYHIYDEANETTLTVWVTDLNS